MKRLLFVVNGLGLGNATRVHAIVERLIVAGVSVEIATSGEGLAYFRGRIAGHALHPLRPFSYGNLAGGVSAWSMLRALPRNVGNLGANKLKLWRLLRRGHFDGVVVDSDYSLAIEPALLGIPLYSINNSYFVLAQFWKHPFWRRDLFAQLCVEMLDLLYQCAFPKIVLCPTFGETGLRRKFRFCGPLLRTGLVPKKTNAEPKLILIMQSGAPDAEPLVARNGAALNDWRTGLVRKKYDNLADCNAADGLVIRGGSSSIGEAIALRKPCLVVPMAGHAEQYINSRYLCRLGLGIMAQGAGALPELLNSWTDLTRRHEAMPAVADGAQIAARILLKDLS